MIFQSIHLVILTMIVTTNCDVNQCSTNSVKCNEKCPRSEVIRIPKFNQNEKYLLNENKIFFIESSNRTKFLARQICSVESALKHNPKFDVYFVITSDSIDLSDNSTCQLATLSDENDNLHLRSLDLDETFIGSPLEELYKNGGLNRGKNKIVQMSDAIRLILIHSFGGFYIDIDFVILKNLAGVTNAISSDQVNYEDMKNGKAPEIWVGSLINNAAFHFKRNHPFIERCLRDFNAIFDGGERESGGPKLITKVLREFCDVEAGEMFHAELKCRNSIRILPQKSFYPVNWFQSDDLYKAKRLERDWKELFGQSLMVHMYYSAHAAQNVKISKRRFYGKEIPAYLHLATNHCPISFDSVKLF